MSVSVSIDSVSSKLKEFSHFVWDKWQTNADQVIDSTIALLPIEKIAEK
jgi:hypothetical protein